MTLLTGLFAFIGAICTALLSGVFAASVTYALNANKDHIVAMRLKAEELYASFDNADIELARWYMFHLGFFQGTFSYEELVDAVKEMRPVGLDYARFKFLSSMYFRGTSAETDYYQETRKFMDEAINSLPKNKLLCQPNPQIAAEFERRFDIFLRAAPIVRAAMLREALLITSADAMLPRWMIRIRKLTQSEPSPP